MVIFLRFLKWRELSHFSLIMILFEKTATDGFFFFQIQVTAQRLIPNNHFFAASNTRVVGVVLWEGSFDRRFIISSVVLVVLLVGVKLGCERIEPN